MAKNKLSDLNDHLFMALERLNDEEMQEEKLDIEIKKAKAISALSSQIIGYNRLMFDAAKSVTSGDIDIERLPSNFEMKRIGDGK